MCVLVNARCLFAYGALLLLANGAYAGGTYQRTKDGKTFVWNNHPRRGDAATWSGDRDASRYARGYGTLTWYTVERVIVTGSNLPSPKYSATGRYSGKMRRGKLDGPVVNVDANGKTFHGTFMNGRKTSNWAAGPAPSPGQRRNEPPNRDAVAEAPAEGPSVGQRPEITDRPTNQPLSGLAVPGTRTTDDSLRSLTSPPSTLRANLVGDASPQASIPSTALSSPARPRLTPAEVIELADAEAGAQGHNLGEYQRPQANYTAAKDTWSVSYDQKYVDANGMAENGKHFSVSVEDKTKKTSIVAGR